ncbi:hypothetical protein ACFL0V_07360 [Nanoarchaeota archaeon]
MSDCTCAEYARDLVPGDIVVEKRLDDGLLLVLAQYESTMDNPGEIRHSMHLVGRSYRTAFSPLYHEHLTRGDCQGLMDDITDQQSFEQQQDRVNGRMRKLHGPRPLGF